MMLSDIVAVGQTVELQLLNDTLPQGEQGEEESPKKEKKIYHTKVFDIISEDRLEMMMPIEKRKLILLPVDGECDLCFYTPKGLYQCFAKVIDRYKSNNIYILVMELTSNLRKHQRREYFRFNCALEMKSRALDEEEVKVIGRGQSYLAQGQPLRRGMIVDISGGGLRFTTDYRYDVESMIYCTYSLTLKDTVKQYHLVGKVLAVKKLENKPGIYEHRVRYVNMDADTREDIIKYIFQEERKQRHRNVDR